MGRQETRPARLVVGDQLHLSGQKYTLLKIQGRDALLGDIAGNPVVRSLHQIFTDPGLVLPASGDRWKSGVPVASEAVLSLLPDKVIEDGRWWERHLIQVIWGHDPAAPSGAAPNPVFDPLSTSMRQRQVAKVAELAAAGRAVALSTVQRKVRQYLAGGLLEVIDGRHSVVVDLCGRADPRVAQALEETVAAEKDLSTGRVTRLRFKVERLLKDKYGDQAPKLPARATFYRWVAMMDAGRHTVGSARTRRTLGLQPKRPFGGLDVLRPGEWMQIDSTPLNIRVVLDNGMTDRVQLTWIIDCLTRSIPAAVLTSSTRSADAALLLAKCVTPEPMRPGWTDAVKLSRSVLPYRHLSGIDERLENAAARPTLRPENIVCDHGMVYLSKRFRSGCNALVANFHPSVAGSPFQKGVVERSFGSVDTLFAQFVKGYTGSRVELRGKDPDGEAVWPIHELQELLDEWIVTTWQNRRHDGIRLPSMPAQPLTPNEACAVYMETSGHAAVPLSADDYIRMMPEEWRVIRSEGVRIDHRWYVADELVAYRRQHSGIKARRGLWEVHYDDGDISRIWVRDHKEGRWITAYWRYLRIANPQPFGTDIWHRGRQVLVERGNRRPLEEEIAAAANDLLVRAGEGPVKGSGLSAKDLRLAGRNSATAPASWPAAGPARTAPPPEGDGSGPGDEQDESVADVVALGVYDARKQVSRWT